MTQTLVSCTREALRELRDKDPKTFDREHNHDWLRVDDPEKDSTYIPLPLNRTIYDLGRGTQNHIRVDHDQVEEEHAHLLRNRQGYHVATRADTFINDLRVHGLAANDHMRQLRPGAWLSFDGEGKLALQLLSTQEFKQDLYKQEEQLSEQLTYS